MPKTKIKPMILVRHACCAVIMFCSVVVAENTAMEELPKDHNAFISYAAHADDAESNTNADGPLANMRLSIKDNIHVAGMPNTAGTHALQTFIPRDDATLIARLKAAGASITGKNNLHELAFGITSANAAFGAVRNAVDPRYIAGGSSGGTAVAVALDLVDAGIGTDTGGSTRIPAALNGIVGFRPTTGRYPNDGMTLISNTRDTAGPITRDVATAAKLDKVMAGEEVGELEPARLEGLRLGVPREHFYANLDPEVARIMEQLLAKLTANGVTLVEASIAEIGTMNEQAGFPIVLFETAQLLPAYLAQHMPGLTIEAFIAQIASPDVKGVVSQALGGIIPQEAYEDAINIHRPALQNAYAEYFEQHQVEAIIFPTTPLPARPLSANLDTVELNGEQVPTFPTYIRNTDPGSNAGIPGISIPAGNAQSGLPVGVELDGPENSDVRLMEIAQAIETLLAE